MSEFQLQPGQGYIYVGEYFHKFGKSVPTEKKIGKIDSLLNIPQLDDYAFSFDDVEKMYSALTHILDHDQLKEDWFEDTDGDLKNRVAKFMEAFGYKEVSDVDGDGIPDHLDDEIG